MPQVQAGTTAAGRQRYRYTACRYKDTPVRKGRGYPPELRRKVVQEHVDGRTRRQIARQCELIQQTVATGVAASADARPAPGAARVRRDGPTRRTLPLCGAYKNPCSVVTTGDRATRSVTGWAVVGERTWERLHEVVAAADPAQQYDSDARAPYQTLVWYPGPHAVALGKSQTDSVEADNAALRP